MTTEKKQPIQESEYTLKEYKDLLNNYKDQKESFPFSPEFFELENLVISNLKHFCNIKSLRKVLVKVDPAFENLAKILNDEEVDYQNLKTLRSLKYLPQRLDFTKELFNYCIRNKLSYPGLFWDIEYLSFEDLLLLIELFNKTGKDRPRDGLPYASTEPAPCLKAFPIWAINAKVAGSRSKLKKIIKKCNFIESNTDTNYQKLTKLSRTCWFIKKGSGLRDEFIEKSVFHAQGSIMSEFLTDSDAFEVLLSLAKSKQQTLMDKLLVHQGNIMEEWRYMRSKPYNKIKREHLEDMYRNDQQFSKKVQICSSNLNLLIHYDFFDDKDLSEFEVQPQYWHRGVLEGCGFFNHFCKDNKNIKLARSPANLELINDLWNDAIQQIIKNSGTQSLPICSADWFRFVDKTKQNLLIGLSIYEGEEFKSFLKYISKAFVTKNDLKLLPLEKRKLIYKKFTEKIDDIFEEAHLSKSLNLQINE